jgi:hypothetical protein
MGDSNTEMRAYTKYSFFVERSMGLGRNGKRLLHGGVAAAGTWAAGHYGGVEIINNNMPQAIVAGGVAGVGLTVLADFALLDDHEQALMDLESVRRSEQSNPEMRKIIEKNREEIDGLLVGQQGRRERVIGGQRG